MRKDIIAVLCFLVLVTAMPAAAGTYDLKEMTPKVEQALVNRRERFSQLEMLKSQGIVGENNRGYVEVLQSDAGAAQLVNDENKDRKVIYETIVEQNNLGGALGTVEKVFAEVQRNKANVGEKIQKEDGAWVTK